MSVPTRSTRAPGFLDRYQKGAAVPPYGRTSLRLKGHGRPANPSAVPRLMLTSSYARRRGNGTLSLRPALVLRSSSAPLFFPSYELRRTVCYFPESVTGEGVGEPRRSLDAVHSGKAKQGARASERCQLTARGRIADREGERGRVLKLDLPGFADCGEGGEMWLKQQSGLAVRRVGAFANLALLSLHPTQTSMLKDSALLGSRQHQSSQTVTMFGLRAPGEPGGWFVELGPGAPSHLKEGILHSSHLETSVTGRVRSACCSLQVGIQTVLKLFFGGG
ncbi:hypothetical protein Esti_000936 [Eimeria stiedai]